MLSRIADFVLTQPKSLLLAVLVVCLLFLWAGLWILFKYMSTYRELTHAERLKMIEAGQAVELLKMLVSRSDSLRLLSVGLSLAAWVPSISVLGATYATVRSEGSLGIGLVAWIAALAISLTSTICAAVVMGRHR